MDTSPSESINTIVTACLTVQSTSTPYWAEIMKLQKMQKITAAEIRS